MCQCKQFLLWATCTSHLCFTRVSLQNHNKPGNPAFTGQVQQPLNDFVLAIMVRCNSCYITTQGWRRLHQLQMQPQRCPHLQAPPRKRMPRPLRSQPHHPFKACPGFTAHSSCSSSQLHHLPLTLPAATTGCHTEAAVPQPCQKATVTRTQPLPGNRLSGLGSLLLPVMTLTQG